MDIILFILGAIVVISIHELGHFLMLKLCGFNVEEISIGIGPKLILFKHKDTKYSLRLIPIGGYVASPELDANYEIMGQSIRIFNFKKMLCYLAGPFFSLVLAIILIFASGNILGLRVEKIYNQQLLEQGIEKDYRLRSINGNRVFRISDIEILLNSDKVNILTFSKNNNDRLYVEYYADNSDYTPTIKDVYFYEQTFKEKFLAVRYTIRDLIKTVIESIGELITGKTSVIEDISNPYSNYIFKKNMNFTYNFNVFLVITAVFSWGVSFFNLLPIIGFDGFRCIYTLIPIIINRKLTLIERVIICCISILFSIWVIF